MSSRHGRDPQAAAGGSPAPHHDPTCWEGMPTSSQHHTERRHDPTPTHSARGKIIES